MADIESGHLFHEIRIAEVVEISTTLDWQWGQVRLLA
jgi:hypothetical protein